MFEDWDKLDPSYVTSAEGLRHYDRHQLETFKIGIEQAFDKAKTEKAYRSNAEFYNRIEEELIRRDTPLMVGDIVEFIDKEDAPAEHGHVVEIHSGDQDCVWIQYHDEGWEDWHYKDELAVIGNFVTLDPASVECPMCTQYARLWAESDT